LRDCPISRQLPWIDGTRRAEYHEMLGRAFPIPSFVLFVPFVVKTVPDLRNPETPKLRPMSPFHEIPEQEWLASNAFAFAFHDRFPVSPGHTLVVTRRPVATFFEATPEEQAAVMALVVEMQRRLEAELDPRPDGWNVGFNCGAAAGQTVFHLHVHLIPRYTGDVDDPRGGVRHVIPSKANYLSP